MMKSKIISIFTLCGLLFSCTAESVHHEISKTVASLDVKLSSVKLDLKADAEDATTLVYMPGGTASLTHSVLNGILIDRGINGGDSYTELALRVVGTEERKDEYVRPVYKDTIILVKGYVEGPEKNVDTVYILGDATDAGWNIDAPLRMDNDPSGNKLFKWKGHLYPRESRYNGSGYNEGSLKFPVRTGSWDCPFFMAPRANTLTSGTVKTVYSPNGQPDNKYLVNTYGLYNVSLDVWNKEIVFDLVDAYSDLDIKRIWMVGDASWGGWNSQPFQIELTHSETDRNVFTWEGLLSEGEFKFPLHHTSFEVDYIRPMVEDAPLADALIQKAGGDPDLKWKVTHDAVGTYKITINTASMTIKFEKK